MKFNRKSSFNCFLFKSLKFPSIPFKRTLFLCRKMLELSSDEGECVTLIRTCAPSLSFGYSYWKFPTLQLSVAPSLLAVRLIVIILLKVNSKSHPPLKAITMKSLLKVPHWQVYVLSIGEWISERWRNRIRAKSLTFS